MPDKVQPILSFHGMAGNPMKGRSTMKMKMKMKKRQGLLLIFCLLGVCGSGRATLTEIRRDFFNRTTDLPATAIMSAPTGDATYLISVYESTTNCAIVPVLRWIDENGVARSQAGTVAPGGGNC